MREHYTTDGSNKILYKGSVLLSVDNAVTAATVATCMNTAYYAGLEMAKVIIRNTVEVHEGCNFGSIRDIEEEQGK